MTCGVGHHCLCSLFFLSPDYLSYFQRSASGEFDRHLTWLYLNYSRVAKDLVAKQFDLMQPLFFSYTHLVCRTALESETWECLTQHSVPSPLSLCQIHASQPSSACRIYVETFYKGKNTLSGRREHTQDYVCL